MLRVSRRGKRLDHLVSVFCVEIFRAVVVGHKVRINRLRNDVVTVVPAGMGVTGRSIDKVATRVELFLGRSIQVQSSELPGQLISDGPKGLLIDGIGYVRSSNWRVEVA